MFLPLGKFIESQRENGDVSHVIFGVPFDGTTSFFPGTRLGPARVREVSDGIETYSPLLDRDLLDRRYFDAGDLDLPFGNPGAVLDRVERATRTIVDEGKKPLMLGGEHLVSLGAIRALHEAYPDLVVVQFDAHADLREDYLGEPLSHATVMRHTARLIGPNNLFQFGIRSGTREEFAFGRDETRFFPHSVLPALEKVMDELRGRPIYLTIDIDVLDPSVAPATGTPEPGGGTFQEIQAAIFLFDELNVVGCDLVELCPPAEQGVVTALVAAKIVRELILVT